MTSLIKRHYSGLQRRAENIIWNAAGDYHFDPPFLAFYENGQPDPYFNMVIGLAAKWLDLKRISAFFASYEGAARQEEFDDILWLGIENCVFEKEVRVRPRLLALRQEKARQFFKKRQTLSRQQMMLQSIPVYNQQQARWASVLGRKGDLLSSKEQSLEKALLFPGSLTADEVLFSMQQILLQYFHYRIEEGKNPNPKPVTGLRRAILKKVLKRESRNEERLIVRTGTGTGDDLGAAQLSQSGQGLFRKENYAGDRAYLERALGKCVLSDADLRMLENNLCTGPHSGCRLLVTGGAVSDSHTGLTSSEERELEKLQDDTKRQQKKNEAYRSGKAVLLSSGIRKLSARIDEILSGTERAVPDRAREGILSPELAYRLPVLHDPDVFLHAGEETERSISVDLLLDASASRLNYQEQLCAEAYVIAKSFQEARVPVQVETFRSLRGFTVLQILKERSTRDCSRIFSYFAGGWNRDGLGLRLAGNFLPAKINSERRILLVLTDASPNDSTKIPPAQGQPLARNYQGKAAVLDAAAAVKELRGDGVLVGAIFLGPTLYLENLHTIYGKESVRIHRIEQLEEAAAGLLEMLLRGVENVS